MRIPSIAVTALVFSLLACTPPGEGEGEAEGDHDDPAQLAADACDHLESCGSFCSPNAEAIFPVATASSVGDPLCDDVADALVTEMKCVRDAACDALAPCFVPLSDAQADAGATACFYGRSPVAVPDAWICGAQTFNTGSCTCGCGAADPSCLEDTGCSDPGCAGDGCDACGVVVDGSSNVGEEVCGLIAVAVADQTIWMDVSDVSSSDGALTALALDGYSLDEESDDALAIDFGGDLDATGPLVCAEAGAALTLTLDGETYAATSCTLDVTNVPPRNGVGHLTMTVTASVDIGGTATDVALTFDREIDLQ